MYFVVIITTVGESSCFGRTTQVHHLDYYDEKEDTLLMDCRILNLSSLEGCIPRQIIISDRGQQALQLLKIRRIAELLVIILYVY